MLLPDIESYSDHGFVDNETGTLDKFGRLLFLFLQEVMPMSGVGKDALHVETFTAF